MLTLQLVYTDFVEWTRIGASEASQRSRSSVERTQQLPGAPLCLNTGKVEVQKVGRGVPGEARVKTGVPCESAEEGEGRGASQQGHT